MTPPTCPYCGNPAKLVSGRQVYPHRVDLSGRRYWECQPCEAWAGADVRKDFAPTGRLSNAELRTAHTKAHEAFDPLWKSGGMTRSGAYRWLATELGIAKALVHIGFFDVHRCKVVIDAVKRRQG